MYASSFIPRWLRRKISPFLVSAVAGSAAVPTVQYVPERAAWAEPDGDSEERGLKEEEKEQKKKRESAEKAGLRKAFLSGLEEAVMQDSLASFFIEKKYRTMRRPSGAVIDSKISVDGERYRLVVADAASPKSPTGTYMNVHPLPAELQDVFAKQYNPIAMSQAPPRLLLGYDVQGWPVLLAHLGSHTKKIFVRDITPTVTGEAATAVRKKIPDAFLRAMLAVGGAETPEQFIDALVSASDTRDTGITDDATLCSLYGRALIRAEGGQAIIEKDEDPFANFKVLDSEEAKNQLTNTDRFGTRAIRTVLEMSRHCMPPGELVPLLFRKSVPNPNLNQHPALPYYYHILHSKIVQALTLEERETGQWKKERDEFLSKLAFPSGTDNGGRKLVAVDKNEGNPDGTHIDALDYFAVRTLIKGTKLETIFFQDSFSDLQFKVGDNHRIVSITLGDADIRYLHPAVGELDALQELYVNGNRLVYLPDTLSRLKNLTVLDASDNPLFSLPDALHAVPLRSLGASKTNVRNVPYVPTLKELYLFGTPLKKIPENVLRLSSLEELYLGDAQLTALPDEMSSLKSLKQLFLEGNPLMNVLESVQALSSLEVLSLSGSQLGSGGVPGGMRRMYNLEEVLIADVDADTAAMLSEPSMLRRFPPIHRLGIVNSVDEMAKLPPGEIPGTGFIFNRVEFTAPTPFLVTADVQATGTPLQINGGLEWRAFFHPWYVNLAFRERYLSLPIRNDVQFIADGGVLETSFANVYEGDIHVPQFTLRVGRELSYGVHWFGTLSQKWHSLSINYDEDNSGSPLRGVFSLTSNTPPPNRNPNRKYRSKFTFAESLSLESLATQAGVGLLVSGFHDSFALSAEYAAELGYAASGKYMKEVSQPAAFGRKPKEEHSLSPKDAFAHHLALRANYQLTNHLFIQAGVESNGNAGLVCRLVGCEGDYGSERRLAGIGYLLSFDEPVFPADAFTLGLTFVHERGQFLPFGYGGYSLFASVAISVRNLHKAFLLSGL